MLGSHSTSIDENTMNEFNVNPKVDHLNSSRVIQMGMVLLELNFLSFNESKFTLTSYLGPLSLISYIRLCTIRSESHLSVLQLDSMLPIEVGCNNFRWWYASPHLLWGSWEYGALVNPDIICEIRDNNLWMNRSQVPVGHSHRRLTFLWISSNLNSYLIRYNVNYFVTRMTYNMFK